MALSAAVAAFLVEATTTTAIDVISRRSIDPKIRMAGRVWRTFSLTDKAFDVHEAIRIAAYSDAAGIVANEIVIQKISKSVQDDLPVIDGLNFVLVEKAEGLLLEPDFSFRNEHDPSPLDPVRNLHSRSDFHEKNFENYGLKLYMLTAKCIKGAVRVQQATLDLIANEECKEPRRTPALSWESTWLDRINTGLGYALWVPVPIIGVGSGYATYGPYVGTFRRDEAEGYGKIELDSKAIYVGQVRRGTPFGYGVVTYPDGTVFAGHNTPEDRDLGVVLPPTRDKAIIGASLYGRSRGFGRQIGLSKGVGSVSGFWRDGKLSLETPTLGSIHRRLRENYKSSLFAAMHEELEENANSHGSEEDAIDGKFVNLIEEILL